MNRWRNEINMGDEWEIYTDASDATIATVFHRKVQSDNLLWYIVFDGTDGVQTISL